MTETPLTPEASVIVPSRGGAQRLPRLIGALAAQEDAPPFEVHVVVDGDVDGSEGMLAPLAAEHPGLDLSWTVANQGIGLTDTSLWGDSVRLARNADGFERRGGMS